MTEYTSICEVIKTQKHYENNVSGHLHNEKESQKKDEKESVETKRETVNLSYSFHSNKKETVKLFFFFISIKQKGDGQSLLFISIKRKIVGQLCSWSVKTEKKGASTIANDKQNRNKWQWEQKCFAA